MNTLNQDLSTLNIDLNTLNIDLSTQNIDLNNLNIDLNNLNIDLNNLNIDLNNLNIDLNNLNIDMNNLNIDLNNMNIDLNNMNIDLNNLNIDLNTLNTDLNALNIDMNILNMDLNNLNIDLNTLNIDLNNLNIDMNTLNIDLSTQNIDLNNLNIDLNNLNIDLNNLNIDLNNLNIDLNNLNIDMNNLNIDLNNMNIDLNNMNIDLNNLNIDLNTLNTDLNALNIDMNILNMDLNNLNIDLNTLNIDLNTLNTYPKQPEHRPEHPEHSHPAPAFGFFSLIFFRLRGMMEEAGVYYVVENGLATAPPALAADATPAQHAAHASQRARVAADNAANLKARGIILRYVSDHHARAVAAVPTAQEAWDQLAAEFVQVSIARQSQLQMQLSQLRMQADETVAGFFARTMLLRDELTSAGCPPSDHSLMLAVLNAMPPEFKIATPAAQYCNYPGHVLSECRRFARDHGSFARPASPSLAQAQLSPNRPRGNSPSRGRGDGAGGRSADSAGSSMQQQSDLEQANVLFMARTNRFPMLSRTEPVATPVPGHLVPENMTDEEFLDFYARMPRWVIDSGANRHIMPWRSCLTDYHAFDPPIQLQLGGTGSSIDVVGEGTTFLTNSAGEQWAVSGVLHAPAAAYCYLSVSELTRAGVTLHFHGDNCDMIGRGNPPEWQMTIRKAPPGVYLWHIRAVAEGRRPNELDPQVWHQRCGHASFSVLTRMQREGMVQGVPVKREAFAEAACSSAVCPGCAMGKQHRRVHFDLSTNAQPVTAPLGLVHMDVCGPMPHVGRDGSRYIATFLDEHTGLSVIQLLPSKDLVPAAIQRVITELETQSGHRCKALRSDNGSEYSNKTLRDWCSSKGIQQQFSAPYCPEQNGKAERLNRTIMQATRSMLLSAQLPPGFWVDAALKANYVRNLLPITGQPVTPWEAFYRRKPNLSALRVFGATAWVYVTQPNRNKLQPKAVKGIFLGYAVGSKAYKLWVNGRLVISKDVQIDETAVLDHHRSMQLPVQSPVPSVPARSTCTPTSLPFCLTSIYPPICPSTSAFSSVFPTISLTSFSSISTVACLSHSGSLCSSNSRSLRSQRRSNSCNSLSCRAKAVPPPADTAQELLGGRQAAAPALPLL
ncbi:hypothetical protein QJQ45_024573 [Haematococcus lacustris]|nr:hypothetical protein QJQ45_024573 [Haematococcus lacustris]